MKLSCTNCLLWLERENSIVPLTGADCTEKGYIVLCFGWIMRDMSQQQVFDKVSGVRCRAHYCQECRRGPNEVLIRPESLVAGHFKTIWGQGWSKATEVCFQRVTEHGADTSTLQEAILGKEFMSRLLLSFKKYIPLSLDTESNRSI